MPLYLSVTVPTISSFVLSIVSLIIAGGFGSALEAHSQNSVGGDSEKMGLDPSLR